MREGLWEEWRVYGKFVGETRHYRKDKDHDREGELWGKEAIVGKKGIMENRTVGE